MPIIAHLADIHWRGLTRHAEYTEAFKRLFIKLQQIKPDIIFIGGDLFHTKTAGISPEVIDRLAWMLRSLADIARTYVVLGNHDGNLANEDRQDAITPIITAMNHNDIVLCKESGGYQLIRKSNPISPTQASDIPYELCVFSCFDKPGWERVTPNKGIYHGFGPTELPFTNIAAFHGSVGGTKMDNGWIMPDSKAEVKIDMFDGYDFVFLGDIHKRQFLAERPDKNGVMKPYIAYPGSLIQQNFGEDETKGFLVWDIRSKDDWDVEFVQVENAQPFRTFEWKDSVEDTLRALESLRAIQLGGRYLFTSQAPLNGLLERQMTQELKSVRGAEEVLFKSVRSFNYDSIIHNGVSVKKTSLRSNKSVVRSLFRQFLDTNTKKLALSLEQMNQAGVVIDAYIDRLNEQDTENTRDVCWSLKHFEFDNLYRYGTGNKIVFDNLDGVVGVFGKNKTGKSSLVGALMYVLFNGSDRDGITKNGQIMNQNKSFCSGKAIVNISGLDYVIERSSSRVEAPKKGKRASQDEFDGAKTETKLAFSRINQDGSVTLLNGISIDKTDKAIRKLLGGPQDFLMTSIATQSRMERFIDEGPSSRKTILNRFMDLDMFDKLYSFAKEDAVMLNAKMAMYSSGWESIITKSTELITSKEKELTLLEQAISNSHSELDKLRLVVAQVESSNNGDASTNLLKAQHKLFSLNRQALKVSSDFDELTNVISDIESTISALQQEEISTDISALQNSLEKVRTIKQRLQQTSSLLKEEDKVLQNQERSVRKLTLVPCGDSFPTCLYIKDSYEDRKTLKIKEAEVVALSESLELIAKELDQYNEQQLLVKMARYTKVQQTIRELSKEKLEKRTQLSLIQKSMKDVANWLKLAQQEEVRLADIVASCHLDGIDLTAKKAELSALQSTTYTQERRKSELLSQISREQVLLEKTLKDQTDCNVLLTQLQVLESIQAAFHKNGIPAIVLKTQLPAINEELSKLLGGLVDFSISLETEAGSNVMDIFIEDAHSKRILELGSGMEKMLASIAIRVALINLSNLPKSDIFVIDEGLNALDEEHIGKCLGLLQTLKSYFKTIMIISHMQRVKEAADSIIEVVSVGEDSKVEA